MKKILIFILLLILVGFAQSCKTTKSSVSVREQCETISQSEDRLSTFSLTDTISKFFALNADSLVIIFDETPSGRFAKDTWQSPFSQHENTLPLSNDLAGSFDDVYFHSSKPPNAKASSTHAKFITEHRPKPTALKVYGLHVDKNVNKQATLQSSLSESNDKSVHSEKHKEDKEQKAKPSNIPKYIFFSLLMAAAFFIYCKVRR